MRARNGICGDAATVPGTHLGLGARTGMGGERLYLVIRSYQLDRFTTTHSALTDTNSDQKE